MKTFDNVTCRVEAGMRYLIPCVSFTIRVHLLLCIARAKWRDKIISSYQYQRGRHVFPGEAIDAVLTYLIRIRYYELEGPWMKLRGDFLVY